MEWAINQVKNLFSVSEKKRLSAQREQAEAASWFATVGWILADNVDAPQQLGLTEWEKTFFIERFSIDLFHRLSPLTPFWKPEETMLGKHSYIDYRAEQYFKERFRIESTFSEHDSNSQRGLKRALHYAARNINTFIAENVIETGMAEPFSKEIIKFAQDRRYDPLQPPRFYHPPPPQSPQAEALSWVFERNKREIAQFRST